MTEKRYYAVDYDEAYYIFDSNVICKGRVEEEAEYSYDVFANSMSSTEIIDKLNELTNENEQLKLRNKQYSMMVLSEFDNIPFDVLETSIVNCLNIKMNVLGISFKNINGDVE